MRTAAQRQVDELNKQKESIAAHLAQISQLVGSSMPALVDALQSAPAQPAVAAPAATAITAAPAARKPVPAGAPAVRHPAAGHAEKASSDGKQADGDGDEWRAE